MKQKKSSSSLLCAHKSILRSSHMLLLFFRGSFKNFRSLQSKVRQGNSHQMVEGFTLARRKDSPPCNDHGWKDSPPQGGRIHTHKEESFTSFAWKKSPPDPTPTLQMRDLSMLLTSVLVCIGEFWRLGCARGGRNHPPALIDQIQRWKESPPARWRWRKGGRKHLPESVGFQVEAILTRLPPLR